MNRVYESNMSEIGRYKNKEPIIVLVRRLKRGDMRAMVVPLMKLHAVFPRLIIVFVQVSVYPIITKIFPR